MNWRLWLVLLALSGGSALAVTVESASFDGRCGIDIYEEGTGLRVDWKGSNNAECEMVLSLETTRPLIDALSINHKTIARGVQPVFRVTTGPRKREALNARYTFFDRVFKDESEVKWTESKLEPKFVKLASTGTHATITMSGLTAGLFHGSLVIHLYSGSPLVHLQGMMTLEAPETAYCYEVILQGAFSSHAWMDLDDHLGSAAPEGDMKPKKVRYRTILAGDESGTLALFPPPHAFFYPKDEADNFGFVQSGARGIGLCQPVTKVTWSPLIDAPPGKYQRMGAFVLLGAGDAAETLEAVKRYTHGDALKEIEDHTTLVTHEHAALTVHDRTDKPRGPAFARAFKRANVKIVQLAEFHGDGLTLAEKQRESSSGPERLEDYRQMYATCRKYSDSQLLVLPGEEPNCAFPGHWIVMFPKPVYFTRKRAEGQPFKEDISPYGTVYHLKDADGAHQMLLENDALAWTAHPRIKSSRACPDEYKDTAWFRSPQWLGATWKSMPSDLSQPRLGVRCLDLLDDMNLWGQRKFAVGEFDCFRVDESSEIYANLNASYLHLLRKPTVDDWSPVLDCLRRGDFFVSTGEVLIHSCTVKAGHVNADVEWTLPLAHAEIVACDGSKVERQTVPIQDTQELGRRSFDWPVKMKNVKWLRVEFWDVADDGAFTQPIYLEP